jgi:hypothetical protein
MGGRHDRGWGAPPKAALTATVVQCARRGAGLSVEEIDIWRTAKVLINQHGDVAGRCREEGGRAVRRG